MLLLLSVDEKCSKTIPCVHQCVTRDEQGVEKERTENADAIITLFHNASCDNKILGHFWKNCSSYDLKKITQLEISPACEPGEAVGVSCIHSCSLIHDNKVVTKRLLSPLIGRILEDSTPRITKNPWESDKYHFSKKKNSRCCTIL
jgi:hypothetical protein